MEPNGHFSVAERRLEGKVAIVMGKATSVGEAIVRLFTKQVAKFIIADVAEKVGRMLAESLCSAAAIYVQCDVSKEEDVSAAVDFSMEKFGQLDIMYNNAGAIDLVMNVAEYDMVQFDQVMNVIMKGVRHNIKHVAHVMIPRKKGCIISTASVAGILGGGAPYSYTTSKHSIIGLTKNGAAELGKYGIRVNIVSPYGVAMAMVVQYLKQEDISLISEEDKVAVEGFCNSIANLQGHTLKVEDIAEAGLYLASDEAKYVSGHNLVVDGEFSLHCWVDPSYI